MCQFVDRAHHSQSKYVTQQIIRKSKIEVILLNTPTGKYSIRVTYTANMEVYNAIFDFYSMLN